MDDESYVNRLRKISENPIKTILRPINPYRINLRKLITGSCLEIGCGIGRNLGYLNNSENIGIDTNEEAVEYSKSLGYQTYTSESFRESAISSRKFDYLLFSHVLEHMDFDSAKQLVMSYLNNLNYGGKVVIICPQKRGFKSDPTHVEFFDFEALSRVANECGLRVANAYSHPLPIIFSNVFIYNEFVLTAERNG